MAVDCCYGGCAGVLGLDIERNMDMTEIELKPCPFCAGDFQTWQNVRDGRSLGCSKCGCGFIKYNGPPDNTAETRIITAWNTRPEVRVKPLVWVDDGVRYKSICGLYRINMAGYYSVSYGGMILNHHLIPSLVAAKDAAQAHHEKLILEALL